MEIREAARKYYPHHAGDVTMSSKRQITIPAAVARDLELKPGVKLAVHVQDGEIVLIPKKMDWYEYITTQPPSGAFRTKEEVDAYLRDVREGWDDHARRFEGESYVDEDDTPHEPPTQMRETPTASYRESVPPSAGEVDAYIRDVIKRWQER